MIIEDTDPRDIEQWLSASGVAQTLQNPAADVLKLYVTVRSLNMSDVAASNLVLATLHLTMLGKTS